MPIFGSRPSSRTGSRPSSPFTSPLASRGPSPGPGGRLLPSKLDSIRIEGNVYDLLKPRPSTSPVAELLPKELHVILRYTCTFSLSKPVHAETIRAEFQSNMLVTTDMGDGQFKEATVEAEQLGRLTWTIWRGKVLEAGKEYSFDFNGELARQTPRSWKTPSGKIEHTLTISFHGVTDSGKMRRTRKTVEVWNAFSMDVDEPRPGLEFHTELEPEMVGTSIDVDKDLEAFVRFPDQCYKGIGRYFPIEISFPAATPTQLQSITHITIDILQLVWFLRPTRHKEHPQLLAKDKYPITAQVTVIPSLEPQKASLPLPDPTIHGRFTSDHLRVRHLLQITFHRHWFGKKVEWEGDIEIFHRDIGWEARGIQGTLEVVRGQEQDFGNPAEEQLDAKELTQKLNETDLNAS